MSRTRRTRRLSRRRFLAGAAAAGATYAPRWLRPPVRLHPPELAAKVRQLRDMAAAAGRDPATITISFKAAVKFEDNPGTARPLLSGAPQHIIEDLHAYVGAGVQHFVLDFSVTTVPEMQAVLDRLATEVVSKVNA